MHHFFAEPSQISEGKVYIEGPDVNHIKNVLRMKNGEQAQISSGQGKDYLCGLERIEQGRVVFDIFKEYAQNMELPSRVYLFQGLPKSDKMDFIVQKAVELGAFQIIPVAAKRSVVKLDATKAAKKTERWNAIAKSGAKQSGRSLIPEVKSVLSFQQALEYAQTLDVLLIPYECYEGMEQTKKIISGIVPGQSIGVFIGPEGGFEMEEVEQAEKYGAQPITLGRRILRTETAGLTTLSILMYHLES